MPLDFRRGKTAKDVLKIDWQYPVYRPKTPARAKGDPRTVAKEVERALPIEQAFEWIAGDDPRPLLVLRECEQCKGTDHALLSRTLSNEQTALLTHWFRCVKLPTNVMAKKHPFHLLFQKVAGEKKVPHLFFSDPNGDHRSALPGDQSQSELWKVMFSYLDRCYAENAKSAIRQLRKLLGQYDKLDAQEKLVRGRIDKEIERNGVKSRKLKKFDKQLGKIATERQKLRAREKKLRDLAIKASSEVGPAK